MINQNYPPHSSGGGYYQAQPPFNINNYIPWIDEIFNRSVNAIMVDLRLDQNLGAHIYGVLQSTGYPMAIDYLIYEFRNQNWDENLAFNTISAVIEYKVFVEAMNQGINLPQYTNAVGYIERTINQVRGMTAQQQPQQNSGYYQQPSQPVQSYQINRNNVGFVPGRKQTEISPQLSASSLAQHGATTMNRESHVPRPVPGAVQFKDTVVQERVKDDIPLYRQPVKEVINISDMREILIDMNDEQLEELIKINELENVQIAEIAASTENDSTPVLLSKTVSKHIPIPYTNDEKFITNLKLLAAVESVEEIINIFESLKNDYDIRKIFSWISVMVSQTVLAALYNRYNISNQIGFPYLSQYNLCNKWLIDTGVKTDIENIVVTKVKDLFRNISIVDMVLGDKDNKKNNKITYLIAVTNVPVLALPWICKFAYTTKELKVHDHETADKMNAVFQSAFAILDDTILCIEIYDAALNHYTVWRRGIKGATQSNVFIVEPIL